MTTYLFPRLKKTAVDLLLEKLTSQPTGIGSAFAQASSLPEAVQYASSGGTRVPHNVLVDMRKAILEIASNKGFPSAADRTQLAKFDMEASIWFSTNEHTQSGEFLRDDVWACITTALLPDVVAWRFSWSARERFHGGIRNALQRLWIRGQLLDRGSGHPQRWELLKKLTEDALVQITERPSIACSQPLSLALAEAWLRASKKYGETKMEGLMRKVTLLLRLQNEIRNLASLPHTDLNSLIDVMFDRAANVSGIKPR